MKRLGAPWAIAFCACWLGQALAAPVAEIVTVEGKGERREARASGWETARPKMPLNASDFVRTLDLSKMAILFSDRTRLQLSPNSTLQIKGGAPEAPTTINLNSGRAWATSKSLPSAGLRMETPSATAAIRGTEWEMAVDDDGRATLSVFSGEVELANDQGSVVVGVGEQAQAERGKAPVKLAIRVSRDRVQWVSSFSIDASRYGARAELPEIAKLIEEQRLADAYSRLRQLAPTDSRPGVALLLADFEIYRGDLPAAERVLREGGGRHAADERFDIGAARVALFDGRMAEALTRARAAAAKRPESAGAWLMVGDIERIEGHAREALAAYARAASLAAKDARAWRGLGIVEAERENVRTARSHLERAIALDPREASSLAELGTLEGVAGHYARARETLERSLAVEPGNYVAWTGLGAIELRAGHPDAAADALSRAAVIEPRYARAHLYLAAALYQLVGEAAALEELKRAAELDPNDPLPHLLRSIVYLDRIEPGFAAGAAQEALKRIPFLKSLNQVADNQRGIANAGYPLAQMGLEAWARNAAHESYLPSWGGSHFFLSDRYPGEFDRRSELMQGFITDPLAFGASNRFQSLFIEPGHHGTLSLRGDTSKDLRSFEPVVTLNGLDSRAIPFAYYVEAGDSRTDPRDLAFEGRMRRFTGAFGAKPTHETGAFIYANHFTADIDIGPREGSGQSARISGRATRIDGGFSYTPDSRSRLWIKAGASDEDTTNENLTRIEIPGIALEQRLLFTTRPRASDVSARYGYEWTDRLGFDVGAESSRLRDPVTVVQDATLHFAGTTVGAIRSSQESLDRSDAAYGLLRWRSGPARIEGGVAFQDYKKDMDTIVSRDSAPGADVRVIERHRHHKGFPMIGAAWSVSPDFVARAACRRWVRPIAIDTLMPVSVGGVPLDDQLVFAGGELQQCRLQADWTIASRSFASVWLDRTNARNLFSPLAGILNTIPDTTNLERLRNRVLSETPRPDQLESDPVYAGAVIHRARLALETLIGPRLAARAHYTYAKSADNDPDPEFNGKQVPYLPRHHVNLGVTWTPIAHAFVSVQAVYRSRRFVDEANTVSAALPAGWDGQVVIFAETPDKRWSAEVKALNIGKRDTPDVFGIVVSYRF